MNENNEPVVPENLVWQGWLFKKSNNVFAGWQKRWFVLETTRLRYYKTDDTQTGSLAVIPLSQLDSLNIMDEVAGLFSIPIAKKTLELREAETGDLNRWIDAFTSIQMKVRQLMATAVSVEKTGNSDGPRSSDGIILEGYLRKKSPSMFARNAWQIRFFVVEATQILYFKDEKSKNDTSGQVEASMIPSSTIDEVTVIDPGTVVVCCCMLCV